ncbi:MAG: aminoacyl-tRNA hydrolase [Candidatus Nealsonbacteria bacterium]
MFLIIGLGNPGEKYKGTWHNIGFKALDVLAKRNGFADFRLSKKLGAEISGAFLLKEKVILAKPQTFMNNSGTPVKSLLKNWKIKPDNLIVIHDDIDIPVGKLRIVKNRGAAGHKGVESIVKTIKTKDFLRVRVGIQPKAGKPREPELFVLRKFKIADATQKDIFQKIALLIETILEGKTERAMTEFNK